MMDDPRDNPFSPTLSPFHIDFILKDILETLDAKDLLSCRAVASSWYQMATPLLKTKHSPIEFHQRQGKTNASKKSNASRLEEFCKLMSTSSEIPFTKFKITSIHFDSPALQRFFTDYSPFIKTLVLDVASNPNPYCTYEQLKWLFKTLKSLEFLDIDQLKGKVTLPQGNSPDHSFWRELPELKLEKITFPPDSEEYGLLFFNHIFEASKNLKEVNLNHKKQNQLIMNKFGSPRISTLASLRLELIDVDLLESMLQVNLVLSEFKFNVLCKKIKSYKFEKLLQKLSGTLEHLALGSPSDDTIMGIKLPKMPKLTKLGLFNCDDSVFFLDGIDFAQDTPSLKSLKVSCGIRRLDWKRYFGVRPDPKPCTTVKDLSVGIMVSDPACAQYLGRVFPNVKRLGLDFPRNDFLFKVWTTWGEKVEDLRIYFHVNNYDCKDRSLCGITDDWKTDFIKRWGDLDNQAWLGAESLDVDPIGIGICNFKNLMRLKIEESPRSNSPSDLSDFAGYFALAKLKNLRVLQLGKSCISATCINYLRQELPMLYDVDIRDTNGPGVFSPEEQQELLAYIKYYEDRGYTYTEQE